MLSILAAETAGELKIEERAAEDGVNNLPDTKAEKPSGIEVEILSRGREKASEILENARKWDEPFESLVQKMLASANASDDAISKAKINANRAGLHHDETLRKAESHYNGYRAEINAFRRNAGLQREPIQSSKPLAIIWLFSLIIVEGVINSFVYAQASPYGLAGGFYVAFVIGLCNVAFAFMFAFFFIRYTLHVNPVKKMLGVVGGLATFCICGTILLFAALYRVGLGKHQAVESGDNALGVDSQGWNLALEALKAGELGFALESFDSAILLAVGAICMLIGIWKGIYFDDPYPGYGALGRAVDAAHDQYEEAKRKLLDSVEPFAIELQRQAEKLRAAVTSLQSQINELRGHMNKLKSMPDDWLRELQSLTKKYREINAVNRVASPPKYFNEEYPEAYHLSNMHTEVEQICNGPRYDHWQEQVDYAKQKIQAVEAAANEISSGRPSE